MILFQEVRLPIYAGFNLDVVLKVTDLEFSLLVNISIRIHWGGGGGGLKPPMPPLPYMCILI